jgi:4-hydroxy-tetrahydrodipicolinate synthase
MSIRFDAGEVITAMVTPFNEDKSINCAAVEKLANHLVDNGSDAVLVAGTTGESPTLTHHEELEVLSIVKSAVGSRAKVLMGAGSNCTATAVEQSKKVQKAGADAILSVVPYYNKPSQAGMVNHFGQIAKAVDLPILLYNIPGRTGVNMCPNTIAKLAKENKNIFAVKQSNPDLDQVSEIISACPDDFIVYSGDDSLTLPMLAMGAYGIVSVAAHVVGTEIKEMVTAFKAGDVTKAKDLHLSLYPIFKKLFMAPNPTPVKAALAKRGIIQEFLRDPLVVLTEEEKAELYSVLKMYD